MTTVARETRWLTASALLSCFGSAPRLCTRSSQPTPINSTASHYLIIFDLDKTLLHKAIPFQTSFSIFRRIHLSVSQLHASVLSIRMRQTKICGTTLLSTSITASTPSTQIRRLDTDATSYLNILHIRSTLPTLPTSPRSPPSHPPSLELCCCCKPPLATWPGRFVPKDSPIDPEHERMLGGKLARNPKLCGCDEVEVQLSYCIFLLMTSC